MNRRISISLILTGLLALPPGALVIYSGCTSGGALGLQDYQRDLLGLAVALLLNPGLGGPGDGAGQPVPGAQSFDVFVDTFFAADGTATGALPVVTVPVTSPTLGAPDAIGLRSALAFLVGVSQQYDTGNPVIARFSVYRTGPAIDGCLIFSLDARRLTDGNQIATYGSTRYVRIDGVDVATVDPSGDGVVITFDLPVNTAAGLGFPNDLAAGQYLAFEMETIRHDGGQYQLLGVEFYEEPDGAPLRNATIFANREDAVCICTDPNIDCNVFSDCNGNGISDDLDLASGAEQDCNANGLPDSCDLTAQTSFDCDGNAVPDECAVCPPLDLVFLMDTSGSMNDEATALCTNIEEIVADLRIRGITVNATVMGITEDPVNDPFIPNPPPGQEDGVPAEFSCLTNNVRNLLGAAVPGTSDLLNDQEDWAPATAVVASGFAWQDGATRLIVPISDEDPQDGDGCFDPGSDRDAISNAITVANANDVFVSVIVAELVDGTADQIECNVNLANDLARSTGGTVFQSSKPEVDLANGISDIVIELCQGFSDCNVNGVPDRCDLVDGTSVDDNSNGIPDECEAR